MPTYSSQASTTAISLEIATISTVVTMTENTPSQGQDGEGYVQFKTLPSGGPLNRWSHNITNDHDFPGAQVSRDPTPKRDDVLTVSRPCSTALASRTRR